MGGWGMTERKGREGRMDRKNIMDNRQQLKYLFSPARSAGRSDSSHPMRGGSNHGGTESESLATAQRHSLEGGPAEETCLARKSMGKCKLTVRYRRLDECNKFPAQHPSMAGVHPLGVMPAWSFNPL